MNKEQFLNLLCNFEKEVKSCDIEKMISDKLISEKVNSIPCYSNASYISSLQGIAREFVFLRVGFMNAKLLDPCTSEEGDVLCVVGKVYNCLVENTRVCAKFSKLPISIQIDIFKTCFDEKFEYPAEGLMPNTEFSRLNADFYKMKPPFKTCYFVDYDDSCHEMTFDGTWDEYGLPHFIVPTRKKGKGSVYLDERSITKITNGDIVYFGFDFAFCLDKKKLEHAYGDFSVDYTIKSEK